MTMKIEVTRKSEMTVDAATVERLVREYLNLPAEASISGAAALTVTWTEVVER